MIMIMFLIISQKPILKLLFLPMLTSLRVLRIPHLPLLLLHLAEVAIFIMVVAIVVAMVVVEVVEPPNVKFVSNLVFDFLPLHHPFASHPIMGYSPYQPRVLSHFPTPSLSGISIMQ